MNKEIREKLLTIIDIASVYYECSDKQKAKIKHLAKEILVSDFENEISDVEYNKRREKSAKIRLEHICTQIKTMPDKYQNAKNWHPVLDQWCLMYYKYMKLISLVEDECEKFTLDYVYAPPFKDYENWKCNNLKGYSSVE
jgi:hypothetical protein